MKKFLISIFVAAIVLWIVMLGCDVFVSRRLSESSDRRFVVWNEIQKGNIDADILIMGSSRAWTQYSTSILDSILHCNSYNLGIDGSAFNRQLMRYNVYALHNDSPKLIIQNIDFMSTLGITDGYEREQFFPYMFDVNFRDIIHDEPFSFMEKYVPFFRYYGYENILKDALGFDPLWKYSLYKGYEGQVFPWDDSKLEMLDTINFECNKKVINDFCNFYKKVTNDDIQVVFVYAPLYIGALKKMGNIDTYVSLYDSIATEHDIPILDYTYSYLSYDTIYFYNASHMNKKGAELFSTMLAFDLNSLNIINVK